MRRLLDEQQTTAAEQTLLAGVKRNHWDPIGSALVISRLDRLVELAEQLVADNVALRADR
ncbi:hypothetical protein ABZS81_16675 [Streptomyces sp. NPDC005318]|uniref:hypothetical protein n=1 Tax=Streptomyces sp. NPDC005318 TaxID=3157031 RepID=UPI0033A32C65